jgi:drug/metabolite transporter (DMT)-like permease
VHRPVVLLILAAGAWGIGAVLTKRAVTEIEPLALLPIQLVSSLLLLTILRRRSSERGSAPKGLARLGLLNPGLAYAVFLFGLTQVTASTSVILWTAEPILILLLAVPFLGERLTVRAVAFSAVAAAGMAIVTYQPDLGGTILGVTLVLAGVMCCALYTVIARRWLGGDVATGAVVVGQQLYALGFTIVLVALAAVGGYVHLPASVSAIAVVAAIASGMTYYGLAYWFYIPALRALPASTAAASFYLVPVFGLGAARILLGEQLSTAQWAGALLVILAVMALLRPAALRRTAGSPATIEPSPEPSSTVP